MSLLISTSGGSQPCTWRKSAMTLACVLFVFNTLFNSIAMAGIGMGGEHHHSTMNLATEHNHSSTTTVVIVDHSHDTDKSSSHAKASSHGHVKHDCCEDAASDTCEANLSCASSCAQSAYIPCTLIYSSALPLSQYVGLSSLSFDSVVPPKKFKPPRQVNHQL